MLPSKIEGTVYRNTRANYGNSFVEENLQFLDFSFAAKWEIFECGKALLWEKGLFDASDA